MRRIILILAIIAAFMQTAVFADVKTTQNTEGNGSYVYVAGSEDIYPVEYYDEDADEYKGIIPDLLAEISVSSGIDFVYINGDKTDKNDMGRNLQVEIVSSSANDSTQPYYKDYLELISYKIGEEYVEYGLVFTSLAEDELISNIKTAANGISADVKSGIYLSYASNPQKTNVFAIIIIAGCIAFALLLVIFAQILRIKRIQKKNLVEKMTDPETGMGNLQFFKHHFRYTIGDVSRSLYYLSYIILDSSYLRSYHGDSSFEDVLRYTSTVLSEHTGDRELSARITENGFAFAFQSTNEEVARKRLEEVMSKLNGFESVKEKNHKLVFHSAAYHLRSSDANCEILLFNLRKNCNKIFGTGKQIIFCDIHSMNVIKEEKELTESILNGFEKKEFKMYLQFVVDNKTKKISSAEALSRWDSPKKGLVGPGKYIANMEMAGLISKHDFYMFELTCRQLEKWKETEYKDISLSCNFTRITLSEENFINRIKTISDSYSFDKSKLAIEITEDAIEKDRETAKQNVMRCKKLGFKIYLDDLGSGYTSLVNLCDYPIDVVKIDRDILLKTETEKGKDLFDGIVALAHSLDIGVICEGVETEDQNALVSSSECDFVQGWYYSKPLPLEECEVFIKKYSKQKA